MLEQCPNTFHFQDLHHKKSKYCDRIECIKNKKRLLHFHDTASILWIDRIDSLSDKEFDAYYYNARDYSCFRDREKRLSRNASRWGFFTKGLKGDYRGVESQVQRFHRRQRSKNSIFAVMLEQELRQENSSDASFLADEDHLAIALVYQKHTKESARLARERANATASQVERQVERDVSSLSCNSKTQTKEIKIDKEEEKNAAVTHIALPWEVPTSNASRMIESRPADVIKYSSLCNHTLPRQYFEMEIH